MFRALKSGHPTPPASSESIMKEAKIMHAVIETGGKQYRCTEGDILYIEKLEAEEGSTFKFENVLALMRDGDMVVGSPLVKGVSVKAKVLANGKGKKITVFTFRKKKNSKRKMGHRQPYTKVQIESIKPPRAPRAKKAAETETANEDTE